MKRLPPLRTPRRDVVRQTGLRCGQFIVEILLALLGAALFIDIGLGYSLSSSVVIGTAALVMTFGLPLFASYRAVRYVRNRFGNNQIAKVATSLMMATGLYHFGTGAGRLLAFYVPFIGAEFQNAKEWGGYGPIEAILYVLEGIFWSYDAVQVVFPSASRLFELGGIILLVGIVLELGRYGIVQKVKS